MKTDEERLTDILRASNDNNVFVRWDEVARNALASGLITLSSPPLHPEWLQEVAAIIGGAVDQCECGETNVQSCCWQAGFIALQESGYRIAPPTKDHQALIANAAAVLRHTVHEYGSGNYMQMAHHLYEARMLVESDE